MRAAVSLLFASLLASSLHATTYVVPSDERLIAAADAIVTGTVLGAHVRRSPDHMIETVTEVAVDEWIKGEGAATVAIVLPGGRMGGEGLTVPGVPSFSEGERVLLFLDRNRRGEWRTWGFALGAFRAGARGVLARAGEVFGWDTDGVRHVERVRQHREFVAYVRAIARGEDARVDYFAERSVPAAPIQPNATFPVGSYSLLEDGKPKRRIPEAGGLRVEWRLSGNLADLDFAEAVDYGIAAWNAANPLIDYSRSPVPASGNRVANDSESRVIANDPHGDVPDGVTAFAMVHDRDTTHPFQGQSFLTISNVDIVFKEGITSATVPQAALNELMTHELGHSLGLRHADRNGADPEGSCGGNANCCRNTDDGGHCESIMHTPVVSKGVQDWDRDAIACLYEGMCTSMCIEPSFLSQPASQLIYAGAPVLLGASVRATPPLSVQWYIGPSGDTSMPFTADAWSMRLRPEASTDYWVRVTGACGSIDSRTAAITVVRCPHVVITSASATIVAPGQVRLRVTAGRAATIYRWFRAPGTLIGIEPDLTTKHVEGATYFVRVHTPCGNAATSAELTPASTPPPARRRRSRP